LSTGNILVLFEATWSFRTVANLIEDIVLDYRTLNQLNKQQAETKPDLARVCHAPDTATSSPEAISRQPHQRIILVETQRPSIPTESNPQPTEPWHLLQSDTILATLQTSVQTGLANTTAQASLQHYGPNLLPESAPRSWLAVFLEQFQSVPVALLSGAAAISVVTGGLADALVIMGVVMINAVIGYVTERQSDRIIRSLKQQVHPVAWVIRDRHVIEISAQDIVPGDILVLRPGTYVPADARVVEAKNLSVDESALTGESLPVTKIATPLSDPEVALGDRLNMVYMGTLVTGGQGLAVVVATARFTEMGKIQTLVGEAAAPETPMQRQLDKAGSQLVLLSSTVCGVVFAIGLVRGYGFLDMLKTSIALAVAAVPEGLPAVATTTLALGIRDMRRQKVLIRHLDAVETLGALQSLCLDKTGTLTANKMSVVELHINNTPIPVEPGYLQAAFSRSESNASLSKLLQVVVLCNESEFDSAQEHLVLQGSATENALLEMAIEAGLDVQQLRQDYPLLRTQHRSEEHNVMQTVHHDPGETPFVAVKGNPTEVLYLCNWCLEADGIVPLTQTRREAIESENDRMAGRALRILGVAYGHTSDPSAEIQNNLVWLGLVGMADPLRKGVKQVMEVFHRAGIDTVMITGDQSPTAYAIGKELDLSQGEQLQILDSTDLTRLDPEVVKGLCDRVHIFSRISPANKLQVVQALQRAGKVVAMTGDGINDAPALKAAEVGIAMGHAGTDVAREVADVVLEDDNLETMAIAISRGRTIYSNIRKSVHFLISTNLSEILVMFAGTSLGLGQPLNAMQLLWLNLVTDIFPGLALALEPPEPDVLNQPPRNPNEPIIQTADFRRIALESSVLSVSALAAYGYSIGTYGISPQSSTIGFMSLTLAQLFHSLSCRSKHPRLFGPDRLSPNPYLAVALTGSIALQLLSAAVPGLRHLLGLAPLRLLDGAVITTSALLPLLVNESTKQLKSQDPKWYQP
jgi:Ca2+-transporting ATPase